MGLKEDLDEKVNLLGTGSGFGDPDAQAQHDREIQHLQFRIAQRNQLKIALISALIGAVTALATGIVLELLF